MKLKLLSSFSSAQGHKFMDSLWLYGGKAHTQLFQPVSPSTTCFVLLCTRASLSRAETFCAALKCLTSEKGESRFAFPTLALCHHQSLESSDEEGQ